MTQDPGTSNPGRAVGGQRYLDALEAASSALAEHDARRPELAETLRLAIVDASRHGIGPGEIADHVTYDRNHVGRIRRAARESGELN